MARTSTRKATEKTFEEVNSKNYTLRVYDTKEEKDRYGAYLTINGIFTIKCNLVYSSKKNVFFLSLPSYKGKDGYIDLCYPITKESRAELDILIESISEKIQ